MGKRPTKGGVAERFALQRTRLAMFLRGRRDGSDALVFLAVPDGCCLARVRLLVAHPRAMQARSPVRLHAVHVRLPDRDQHHARRGGHERIPFESVSPWSTSGLVLA